MRVFDMIVAERRHAADLISGLSTEQLRQPSLCDEWTVREVAAHLVTYLRFGQLKIYFGVVCLAADFDRLNLLLTRRAAEQPTDEIVRTLRRHAGARTTIPRSGFDPVLADLVLHDLDVRRPLGISRTVPEDRLWVTFNHLAAHPSPGFAMGARLAGLRLEAEDTGWRHGSGALVRGPAEDLVLGIAGRRVALDRLDGDGVALLRQRLLPAPRPGALRRLSAPLRVLLTPPPKDRRSRRAVGRST
jgi:uncharacterized protein (TIGR03083 family)